MEPRIDFAKVKASISIAEVLAHYNVKVFAGSKPQQFKCLCPLPSHKAASAKDQKEKTFSFGISKNGERKWRCWADGCRAASDMPVGGDVIDLVCLMEGIDPKKPYPAFKLLVEWFPYLNGGAAGGSEKKSSPSAAAPSAEPKPEVAAATNPPIWNDKPLVTDPTHEELRNRGITIATAVHWGVGYYERPGKLMHRRIVFPIFEDGHLVAHIGRTIDPVSETNRKWLVPEGLKFTFLYGLERCNPAKPLYLVESCWEVLKFHQAGLCAAALLGTNLTEMQERRLEPFKTIWLMLDDDEAGHKATEKIADRLKAKHTVLKGRLKNA